MIGLELQFCIEMYAGPISELTLLRPSLSLLSCKQEQHLKLIQTYLTKLTYLLTLTCSTGGKG